MSTSLTCTAILYRPLRSEFPGHQYVFDMNATRPIYTDDPSCMPQWKALYKQVGLGLPDSG